MKNSTQDLLGASSINPSYIRSFHFINLNRSITMAHQLAFSLYLIPHRLFLIWSSNLYKKVDMRILAVLISACLSSGDSPSRNFFIIALICSKKVSNLNYRRSPESIF